MKICVHCEEEILPFETIADFEGKVHRECAIRIVVGSVNHQQRKCSCFGGSGEDDKNLSRRENARASFDYFVMIQEKAKKARFN